MFETVNYLFMEIEFNLRPRRYATFLELIVVAFFCVIAGSTPLIAQNSIVLENQKAGNPQSEWDLSGPGQYSGSGVTHFIEGFAADLSVNKGQTVNFKINTDSADYRIDIYRLGYYAGMGARRVASSVASRSQSIVSILSMPSVQPTPIGDPSIGLVDAGNWTVSASWAVPSTAVSGVYIAHLVRQDAVSGENHIPFIVRDDGVTHDIVFKTSDTTWQAYNGWGGYNLYGTTAPGTVGSDGALAITTNPHTATVTNDIEESPGAHLTHKLPGASPATLSNDGRAYKVSYNRPIATRDSIGTYAGPQDFLFGAEYSAIRWLEANGYDMGYISSIDADRNGSSQFSNYKIFMSTGHDEYWSGGERTDIEAARAVGVNLVFISGNECFWKTRWEPSTDASATPYRTLVCYKETRDDAQIDPEDPPTWTGAWRDPSFSPPDDGGRPENALSGTIFQVDAWRSDIITIPYPMTQLRLWRNTPNVAKTLAGSYSLVPNLLGYEWDQSPDNGFRPPGLIHLSSTTLQVGSYLLDYGATDGTYTATHNLSLYRDPTKGALVFGAGTVFWAWGLDADHDLDDTYPTPVDPNVQQAMVNLFADMGVQPGTLQTGLVPASKSTNTTPPVSTISAPAAGASVVEEQAVTITGSATATGGQVADVDVSTDGGATWHAANGTTTWSYTWWAPSPGTYTIESRAVDDSLNLEVPKAGISVTVTPATTVDLFTNGQAPAAVEVDDPNAVELGVKFQASAAGTITGMRFYKNPYNTGTHVGNLWSATGNLLATATFTNETASGWQQANFSTPVTLSVGTTYVASYHTNGFYSGDPNYFAATLAQGPLTALSFSANGGNGLYAYGSSSSFPTSTYTPNGTNYWVDVVFKSASGGGPPVANNVSGFITTENTALAIPASTILANDTDPNGYPLSITSVSNPTNGTVTYSASTQMVTFVPTTGYTGPASFTYTITDGHGGNASALVSLTVTVPTVSLFSTNDTPATVTDPDGNSVELGVKFQTATAGQVTGIRFYKGPQNTGTHVGNLWSATGALLATATFTNETTSGWQQVNLSNPVTLTVGTTYVVSYHCNGFYSDDVNYFATAHTNGPLTAPASGSSGGNGVYAYGSTSSFPTSTYEATNYWVDVAFAASASGNQPPVANNVSGFVTAENTPLPIPASAILANDTDPNGYPLSIKSVSNPTNGTVTYDATTQTVTFVPTTGYTGPASFTYTITDTNGGTASATVSLTVSATVSLFSVTDTPATVTDPDGNPVELGVKFQTTTAGEVTAIRFYKGPNNTGTHVGNLWSATGTLLATATFTNETTSGWQQVNLSNPVTLTVGTTYIVSYHSNGFYSDNANYFATAHTSGPLTAPASGSSGGNGVYVYGSSSAFPTSSYQATNYWVDIVFAPN
jgi:Domain of unknown function (DUF4082)/Cadherin-like domain/Bacterial Ig domain